MNWWLSNWFISQWWDAWWYNGQGVQPLPPGIYSIVDSWDSSERGTVWMAEEQGISWQSFREVTWDQDQIGTTWDSSRNRIWEVQ